MQRGEADPSGENDQRERVDERREHARTLVSEGLFLGRRAGLEVDGDEREDDGEHVGNIMSGLRDERERVGAHPEVERGHHVAEGRGERDLKYLLHLSRRVRDHVHTQILYLRGVSRPATSWVQMGHSRGLVSSRRACPNPILRPLQDSATTMLLLGFLGS